MGAGLRPLPLTAQAVHLCVDMCEGVKIEMKKNLSTIIAAAIVASLFMLPADGAPRSKSATTHRGDTTYRRKRDPWTAASRGGLALAGLKRSSTTDWGFPTDPTAIDARRKRIGGDNLATGVP